MTYGFIVIIIATVAIDRIAVAIAAAFAFIAFIVNSKHVEFT